MPLYTERENSLRNMVIVHKSTEVSGGSMALAPTYHFHHSDARTPRLYCSRASFEV
jgi:hypothetical protein